VVMAAGIDAAGDVQADVTQVVQVVKVIEALLDRLGDGDRLGIGQGAEVTAGAGDDEWPRKTVSGLTRVIWSRCQRPKLTVMSISTNEPLGGIQPKQRVMAAIKM